MPSGIELLPTYRVCGIPIAALRPDAAATAVLESVEAGRRVEAHLCNAYTLSLVDRDPELRRALERAHLNLPDGSPVAWLGRAAGVRAPVRGPGLVVEVARRSVGRRVSHYFYGGADGVADQVVATLNEEHPGIRIAAWETPPFRTLTDAEVDDLAARIRASGANLVWIGLGTPRQDYLVPRLADRLEAVIVPVGAAFDFLGGQVGEAPRWLQGRGLEWLHRLYSEPRRLWRRYLIGNPLFLWSVIRHRRS